MIHPNDVEEPTLFLHNISEHIPGTELLTKRNSKLLRIINLPLRHIMVFYSNGKISPIENFIHNTHTRDRINSVGLHIYLFEPMCSYEEGTDFNFSFYSEFADEVKDIRSIELDSIKKYVLNNKLTNVTVHTGDYKAEEVYLHYTPYFNICCDDLFLKYITVFHNKNFNTKVIEKKFISTNWRFTPSRCIISAALPKEDTYLSWYFKTPLSIMEQVLWLSDLSSCPNILASLNKLNDLNNIVPKTLDVQVNEATFIPFLIGNGYPVQGDTYLLEDNPSILINNLAPLAKYYNKSFVDIVNESRFAQPTANLSEKTTQAIQFMTPFILVAPPKSLEYLKTFGFKTFDKWWDESYDNCLSHTLRLEKVLELINYINSLSISDLTSIYQEMLPILNDNLKTLVNLSLTKKIAILR